MATWSNGAHECCTARSTRESQAPWRFETSVPGELVSSLLIVVSYHLGISSDHLG